MRAAIEQLGPGRTAELLADELVLRAGLHEVPELDESPIAVRLALRFGSETVERHIRAGKTTEHSSVPDGRPHATVSAELVDLVRAVLGPWGGISERTVRIVWHDLEVPERLGTSMHVFPVVRRLVRAATGDCPDLADLSLRGGSDKWGLHFCTPHGTSAR
ncbi:hypothetical protein ACIBAI_26575 [Streptomyces sp. NPDC051041]|uniref:hypothetical protein n=1 Tax=Streptomyces sp. NPDC051041 TaxID=3365640 RepID=UPI0037A11AFB